MGAGISRLQGAMPTNAGTLYGSAQANQNTLTTGAQANVTDSSKALGTIAGDLSKNVAPNLGYMLNRPGTTYTNPDAARIQDLEDEIRDLQRSNRRLRGVSNEPVVRQT